MNKIKIGARGSLLSKAYVKKVKELILKNCHVLEKDIFLKEIKTSGDIFKEKKLSKIGGKKLFCKEIEEELLKNNIDIAVHSLKDMEGDEHRDLMIGAFLKRNDPRDVLISEKIKDIKELNSKTIIGSSSRRRELQLKKICKNISFVDIRGNIDTRIKKLSEEKLDGIVLAAAGIKSLQLEKKISFIFDIHQMLPAIGQGIIAVQCRKKDNFIKDILKKINDEKTSICAFAERSLLKTIGGDCETAIGGLAEINNNNLKLKAELFSDDGNEYFNYHADGKCEDAHIIGKNVGEKLLSLAGTKFKKK